MSHRLVLPQTNAPVCPGLAEPSGGFARGRASTPIRTWSARAIAPPPGSPGAATDADQPHRQRVRQTSLPRHSGCRSTERPFRCVVVDHTVRPSQAVPSREGTPVRHDQHQRPARNPPSVDRPLLPAEPSTYAVSSGVSFRCRQGVSFECRLTQAVGALARVALSLRDPVADRLGRRLELPSQLARCTSGPHQLDHLLSECRRVRRSRLRHRGLLLLAKRIGVHGIGPTPGC